MLRVLPYRFVGKLGERLANRLFEREAAQLPGESSVAYFWPDAPHELIKSAKTQGMLVVREMINCPCLTAKHILDNAYRSAGLPATHPNTAEKAAREIAELALYDLIFASNAEVEAGLREIGVPAEKIRSTAFGWVPPTKQAGPRKVSDGRLRFLFLGTVEVRKGIFDLMEAWDRAQLDADLLLAGGIDAATAEIIGRRFEGRNVRALGFVDDVETLLQDCDIFVFPTYEEGGPQVTYEAAGAGLAIITTPMGASRIAREGETALIIPPGDPMALAAAMRTLAGDAELRRCLGNAAGREAPRFTYERVGRQRAEYLLEEFNKRAQWRNEG